MRPLHALRYLTVLGVLVAQLPDPPMIVTNALPRAHRVLPPLPRHIRALTRIRIRYANAATTQFLNEFKYSEMLHSDALHWWVVIGVKFSRPGQ